MYGHVQAPHQYYMLCSEVYQKAGLKQLHTDECVSIRYVSNIIAQQELTNEDLLIIGKIFNMDVVPEEIARLQVVLSPGGCYDASDVCQKQRIRHDGEDLMHEFEKLVKHNGRITLQSEGGLDWLLSVRYTYDKVTSAIGCNQEAYIDRLLASMA